MFLTKHLRMSIHGQLIGNWFVLIGQDLLLYWKGTGCLFYTFDKLVNGLYESIIMVLRIQQMYFTLRPRYPWCITISISGHYLYIA